MARKVLAFFVLLTLAAAGVALSSCGGDLPGNAVAKVGDTVIKESDFQKHLDTFAAQYGLSEEETDQSVWSGFKQQVLEYLITYEMAREKAEADGLTVTDQEFQDEVKNIVTIYFNGDEKAFEDDLKSRGMTREAFDMTYRESMLLQKVYDKVTEGITEVPEEEIQAYYDAHKDSFYVEETRTARHILIAPDGKETNDSTSTTTAATTPTDADWEKALMTAKKVRALLVSGGDWKELAAKYSDDPGTAANGGELGAVSAGEMVPEFDEALFSLQLNEISQPVKSSFGYHIIQVTAINQAHQMTLDEVRDTIKNQILGEKQAQAWQEWLKETKTKLGVVYREDMQPTTTTSSETTSTTSGSASPTSSEAGGISSTASSTTPASATSTTKP